MKSCSHCGAIGADCSQFPPIGAAIRCLRAPRFAVPKTAEKMLGQTGTVKAHYPADPTDPEDEPFIGIQYPLSPYTDGTIALPLSERGESWATEE